MKGPFLLLLNKAFDEAYELGREGASPRIIQKVKSDFERKAGERRVTRKDAAKYLGLSLRRIDNLLEDGELHRIKEGRKTFIPGWSLLRYEQQRSGREE